jgi:hypothetical protein
VIEKLNKRIQNLTEVLQQTTKASFNLFVRKVTERSKKHSDL